MPSLSERDLGHVEKLFNAIRSVLEYDHTHRTHDTPAGSTLLSYPARFSSTSTSASVPTPSQPPLPLTRKLSSSTTFVGSGTNNNRNVKSDPSSPTSTMTPSKVLMDHQDQLSERSRGLFSISSTGAVGSGISERRLWAELAFLIWRVVGLQKLSLMAFVTNDPGLMLVELARALLSFLKESCATFAGQGKEMRMRQVALLGQDRLLFLLRIFCNLKNCTMMLSETSGASSAAADGRAVFDAICAATVAGQHFAWMSQIYVWYCDEAARFARSGGAIPSAYVYATHDALRCILGCCTNQEVCARAFLYSEPVACVTYMFYGLKLRISTCDVLRPDEDDHPLKSMPPMRAVTTAEHLPGNPQQQTPIAHEGNVQWWTSPIPLRPPGARYLKTRYFGSLTVNSASALTFVSAAASQQQQRQQREGPIVVNCSAVASLVRPSASSSQSGTSSAPSTPLNLSTSWAFDTPDLTREQLKQLLLGGRENSFDALLFAALDVVVEVLRVTRDYGHCMVLSTVNSLLLLSKKNIEVTSTTSSATAGGESAGATGTATNTSVSTAPRSPPSLSQVVAMYENIIVMFEFLFSLMQGLDDDAPTSGKVGSGSPDTEKSVVASATSCGLESRAAARGGKQQSRGGSAVTSSTFGGNRNDVPSSASCMLGTPARDCGGSHVGFNTGSGPSTPIPEGLTNAATTAPYDTPQLREDLSQHLVHMVLQTDVHAVVAATTRVLQCDRTLFRVLHQFCVLDARPTKQPILLGRTTDKNSNNTSMNGGSAATLVPYLSSGSGVRHKRRSNLDNTNNGCGNGSGANSDSGAPVFNAAASFFITANFGDLRQMVNEIGVGGGETLSSGSGGPSGELGGSQSSLHGSRGSGLGGSTVSANASQQRLVNRSGGKEKKGGGNYASGSGTENFAKSIFKSFFSSGKKGGGLFTRGITSDAVDDAAGGNGDGGDSWDGRSGSDDPSSSFSDVDIGNSDSDDDYLGNTLNTSGTGPPPTPRSFGIASGGGSGGSTLRRSNVGACSLRRQRPGRGHRHRHSRTKGRLQHSPWRDVPSYTALVSEFVRIFNLVMADAELSIDVRLGAGLLLPSIVLRDNQVFRLYEGRVLIRNYLSLLLHELQHNIKLRLVTDDSTQKQQQRQLSSTTDDVRCQNKDLWELPSRDNDATITTPTSTTTAAGNVVSGRAHLTQRELIAFSARVIEALEQTFKVLGATPLTSDVVSLTELPLYFFCADGKTPLGLALEHSFTRVVVLWLIGLVGAQCDEDMDKHAMEVLLHLMGRAVTRGSLPKDSGTTLMLNAAGTATVVQISPVSGAAVPTAVQAPPGTSSGEWVDSRRLVFGDDAVAAAASGAAAANTQGNLLSQAVSAVGSTFSVPAGLAATSLAGGRVGPATTTPTAAMAAAAPLAPLADEDSGDLSNLHRSHVNNSLFDNTEFVGLTTGAGVDRAMTECGNTVEALGSVFRVLLGRSPDLLTPAGLGTVLALFANHDSNVSRLGRECMTRSLETPSSYALYADVIRDSDTQALTQTLTVISAYLNSAALTTVARHERRVWMQRSGCVDAVIRVLVRVLDSPHSTPNFMKVIPNLFQLLSAFESVDHKPPQLAGTNFVTAVTEQLEKLEGTEYFIIITQAVLDSCMGTYGGVDGGYTSTGGPGAHYAEMHVVGNFHIAQYNCAAEKPVFLDLLPPLLRYAEKHSDQLYSELVEVLFRIVECTGNVRSDRLADFILDHGLSQMLPYLELSGPYIEERLPFTGSATELHRFWQPVLLRAPRRSELRFTSYGGVQISVGTWPDSGFTIASWFKFDRLYTTIPLFEFHGVMNDSNSGVSSPRGSSSLTALLFVFGGDSMQLTLNDTRRITVNENQALQNFASSKWMHICAVLRTTQVLDVYMSGFKVGTATFPTFSPGTEVRVNVGCTDEQPHHQYSSGTNPNATPLFSISDVTLWAQALNRTQVEAELASNDCRAVGNGRLIAPAKILEEAIPQELTLVRNAGISGAGTAVGSPGLSSGNFAGFAALINSKSTPSNAAGGGGSGGGGSINNPSLGAGHDTRSVLGLSFTASIASGAATTALGAGGANDDDGDFLNSSNTGGGGTGSGWTAAQSRLPISTRIARFVPYENEDNLLRNVLFNPSGYPVVAKLVGRYATPPKTWIDYPLLWATRGGVIRLLDWLHLVTSSAQLEGLLQLITECILRTTLAVTLDPRTYMLLAYMLTHHVSTFFTPVACDHLLTLASSHINVFDEEHRIIINRVAFEHILGNAALYAALPLDAALYLLQRVRRLFHASQCRYAKHNARFVIPYRFVDRLLHSLVNVATQTPLPLRRAVVQVAQQVIIACDMEEGLVQIFVSLVALLTPDEVTVVSRLNPSLSVTLPTMSAMTHGKQLLPLRTANNITTLLLTSLVECVPQGTFITALARTVDLSWYASCLSRFADPASVVFATRIFFEAVEHNPLLLEDAMQHQAAIVEALAVHAAHEDLVLLLLAQTVGAVRHIDVLSRKHSLLQQLDSVMNTFQANPNSLVAPIFVKIFVVHLYQTMQSPRRQGVRSITGLLSEPLLSYRVHRYLSLVRVCSRMMILIRIKRYRTLLIHHLLVSATDAQVQGPVRTHLCTRSAGMMSNTSSNMSFAQSAAAAGTTMTAYTTTTSMLGNLSFASNALVNSTGGGESSNNLGIGSYHHNMPSFAASPLGLREAVVNSGDGGGPPQALSPQTPSLVGRSSFGGDGYADDGELPANRSLPNGHNEARQPLLPPMTSGGDNGNSGEDEGIDEAALQWKPPVLLPDMRSISPADGGSAVAAPAASRPTTPQTLSTSRHPLVDPNSITEALAGGSGSGVANRGGANVSRITKPLSPPISPTSAGANTRHMLVNNGNLTGNVSKSGSDNDDVNHEDGSRCLTFYVHYHMHKRAFAVLRTCLLLWLSLQVRRLRWILTPHMQPDEEDYSKRHAGTLFCIRMFRHYASFSSNFYLFVNSPLQIGALSALVAYISRDMLTGETDTWDQVIRSMITAPARETATTTMTEAAAATVIGTPTTYESSTTTTQEQQTLVGGKVSTFQKRDLDTTLHEVKTTQRSINSGNNREDTHETEPGGSEEEDEKNNVVKAGVKDEEMLHEKAASTTLPLVLPLSQMPPQQQQPYTAPTAASNASKDNTCSCSCGGKSVGGGTITFADEPMHASVSTAPPALSARIEDKEKSMELPAPASASAATPPLHLPPQTRTINTGPTGSPTSATQRMPHIRSMSFRSTESSSAELDQMTVLESPEGSVQFVGDADDDTEYGASSSAVNGSRLQRRGGGGGGNSGSASSLNDGDGSSSMPNLSFSADGPPLIHATRVPPQRLLAQLQQPRASSSLLPSRPASVFTATGESSPPFVEEAHEATRAGATTKTTTSAVAAATAVRPVNLPDSRSPLTTPLALVGAASLSRASATTAVVGDGRCSIHSANLEASVLNNSVEASTKTEAGGEEAGNDNDDVDSSSVSSGASFSSASVASTSSIPATFSSVAPKSTSTAATENTAPSFENVDASAKKAVNAPAPSFSNLPDAPNAILAYDPTDAYAVNVAKVVATISEVMRRDAVGILRALIRSSLNTLPVPRWIGGATYGSCGGLLFQLLLIVSAKAATDDATTTLVRYFLLTVGNAVKEQRDRELQPVSLRQDSASPLGASSPPSAAPAFPGLGNTSFSQSGGTATTPLRLTRGASAFTDAMRNNSNNSSSGSSTFSDVFLFNVNHFTDLIVDMLAINVLDLPMATHYFLTLLVLCQEWPSRYIDQLSWQVMRACIAVLNRPSVQDASVGLIESIYTLTTLVLRHGWKRNGMLECLFRVLYRVYASLPPAWMSDEDAKHRRRLITLIFRHIVQTYAGTKELEKALTVRTLTQRLSLYDDFVMIFSLADEAESTATFEQYCIAQSSSIETLMTGRLKAKADLAFKASIKTRGEYIKRIKAFNNQYVQATEVVDQYRKAALRNLYASRFSSYVATTPLLEASQLHWLLSSTCTLRDDHRASAGTTHTDSATAAVAAAAATTKTAEAESFTTSKISISKTNATLMDTQLEQMHRCGEVTLYHFLDSQANYGEMKGVLWGTECAGYGRDGRSGGNSSSSQLLFGGTSVTATVSTSQAMANSSSLPASSSGSRHSSPDTPSTPSPLANTRRLSATHCAFEVHKVEPSDTAGGDVTAARAEQPGKNDLVRAAQCEELVQHIAVLLPPFSTRCRPHIGDEAFPISLKDLSITLTPSAMTLLQYLLPPHQTLRFISNGFRINGIHATPCLILLTNTALTLIGFSRVTEAGDIILCEYEDDDDDVAQHNNSSTNNNHDVEVKQSSPSKTSRRNLFSVSSMTKQLQKFFTDSSAKRQQQQDGTRVVQAVRQVMGRNYQNIFWSYLVSSIRAVRSLRYMHLDTAVQLQLYYDEGPMLSVVDAKQSMNPSARKVFIKVLKDVVAPQQCTFLDETQRAASMKSNLVRWATGALSNFEYLRFLNEVAGRTNRDLNQYPVFPWVLADYGSATLDLESAATFRNFGYPMGAQTEARRGIVSQLFENTREVCDVDTGKSYPFHHGTHYSTSGGVLYFLIRAQPFTTYARLFQGGDFDLAMRLFDSVAASFSSCVMGPADCKELIPEFYVNNNFLANADHLSLGIKSDGEPVDDVRLPPWAKNSRQVFTAVMRYALESYYVVEHLHQWIDLVFGVRRRGPLAMERYNVFQRMTYGEEVAQALKDAETPHDCDVIIAEVDNFGQTPPQLFQERHPSHQELVPVVQSFAADGLTGGYTTGNSGGGSAGSANNANNSNGGAGGAGGRGACPGSGNVSAITLGGLYTSAHTGAASTTFGAGTQLGLTFSNLLSSGTFASGQTYTQAFRREAPKVVRMLIHSMDETQAWFVLRDPPNGVLQHPPPPALVDNFSSLHPAVLHFTQLHTSKKLACAYAQLVPVPDTDHYLCWHEREARLMRYSAGQAVFQSMVAFNPPDESGARISAVAVGTRESILLIAISTGAVYCLFPDDVLNGALHLRVTLCYHRNPVEKIVLDSTRHRAVTITRGHSDDGPILWRVQRSGCNFLCRLSMDNLRSIPTDAKLAVSETAAENAKNARNAVDVAVDTITGHIAIVTPRSLVIFDNNGEVFGVGTLPSPNTVRAGDTVTLEDDNGDVGVVVGRATVVMSNLSAVCFYQTSEWAAGMSVLLTGHVDGSISVWRCTRLPPDTVQPGKIAVVEFHARLFAGSMGTLNTTVASDATASAAATNAAAGSASDQDGGTSAANGRGASLGRNLSILAAGSVGTGTGSTNCPVTSLHQDRTDVPTFLVGYENGSIRQLVFDDPALTAPGGSGGGGGKDGGGGDDRGQRR